MSTITQFNGLSTDELLRHVDEARAKSPVIEELCQRLERGEFADVSTVEVDIETECPVCLADLQIKYKHELDGDTEAPSVEVGAPL